MNGWALIGAALAGGLGAGLRYIIDALIVGGRTGRLPLGILVVNVTGCFALGLVTGFGAEFAGGSEVAWIIGVGLLGGYTTFSTMSVDSVLLAQTGDARHGWLNALGTLVLGVGAAALGLVLTSQV